MSEAALRGIGQPRAGALRLASDARLVHIAVRGERRAFAAIFQRYHQELYRYCRALLGDAEEAADALQNTMVKVMRALPGESREIALRPWLYRIAHNEAVALLRQRRPTSELTEEIAPGAPLEQRVQERERLRRLVDDLRSLPERQRGALLMRELNQVDYSAIGAAFGTSSAVARQTVYEARVALEEMAEGREMSCEVVRRSLSEADGRVLRGRRLRAHLRECRACRDFRDGIRRRRADLRSLAPAMPAAAAAGMFQGILGAGGAGGGGAGGLAGSIAGSGKVLAGSTGLKAAAAVAATATIAVGAADVTGVIHPPLIGGSSSHSVTTRSAAPAVSGAESGAHSTATSGAKPAASGSKSKPRPAASPPASRARQTHSKSAAAPGRAAPTSGAPRGNSAIGHSHAAKAQPKAPATHAPVAGANATTKAKAHPVHPAQPSDPSRASRRDISASTLHPPAMPAKVDGRQ
jgi:RNA polymerase sigma factor (sigma-70 family)